MQIDASSTTITIIDSTPTDSAALVMMDALSARLAAITGSDGRRGFQPDALATRACILLAMQSTVPVGCGALRPLGPAAIADIGEIKRMYAHLPGLGIGSRLLAALEDRARVRLPAVAAGDASSQSDGRGVLSAARVCDVQ